MCDQFSRDMMKVSVAKMLQTIGWNSIQSTPLEILTDIAVQYTSQLAQSTHDYANEFGCVEPNLDHLGLALRDSHVNLSELEEFVTYVNFAPPPTNVPKYPVAKENSLNFLKPGSKEVVTRPVHVHEHLPPMFQNIEETENEKELMIKNEPDEEIINVDTVTSPVFKRPADVSPGESYKRPRLMMEEEGRPTREISSVMMTTSGYISPAREGKLPESRTPLAPVELPPPLPAVNATSPNSSILSSNGNNIKPSKLLKKQEKKKEKVGKELFKTGVDEKISKVTTMKDVVKLKQMKAAGQASNLNGHVPVPNNNVLTNHDVKPPGSSNKVNKTLAAARLKTEKLNTTITPIIPKTENVVDKLFTEPDKKKVNILKKISNVKNEKLDNRLMKLKEEIKQESRESSPDLIIDESHEPNNKLYIPNDITIELVDTQSIKTEKSEKLYFDDDSPPGTPSTPKTPEMISQSPPVTKEKRKRKDKTKVKKVQKLSSPQRMDSESGGFGDMDRPKTPEAQVITHPNPLLMPPFPPSFFPSFGGPGLIPPPLCMNFPLFDLSSKPPIPSNLTLGLNRLPKMEETLPKMPSIPKPPLPSPPIINDSELLSPKIEKKTKEHKKEKKDKIKKKNKKDKIKNKAEKKKLKEEKKDKDKIKKEKKEKRKEKELRENLEITIPKLTLKLGTPSPRPETPDAKKLSIKPIIKKEEEKEEEKVKEPVDIKREMSPELAKISALVTGQPKPKTAPTLIITTNNNPDSFHLQMKKPMFKPNPKIRPKEIKKDPNDEVSPTVPSKYIFITEEEQKEDNAALPAQRNHPGPGRPRIHPIKPKSLKPNKRQLPMKDSEGNEVWICPGCGRQDDGSPMIGCDDCDAWYHWVCVGIQVPPDDHENWYCRNCIERKKQETILPDKKKKRKKREKKEHN